MSIWELPPSSLSVSDLTDQIRELLEAEFSSLMIEGEISNFKRHSSGHWYFTLQDRGAQIRCAAFRNHNIYIRLRPQDGLQVRVRGRLSVYNPRGEYQLVVTAIELLGQGARQSALAALQHRLDQEGLFDPTRKRPLPTYPQTIGIITSPTGAVVQDILQILARRNPTVTIYIYPARVQGAEAVAEIIAGINYFNHHRNIDTLIVGRGGGSIEDLWAFNEEAVVRAIAQSQIPVISAVGHEVDVTLADLAADHRAPTPSAAAELVAAPLTEMLDTLNAYQTAIIETFQHQLLHQQTVLEQCRRRLAQVHPLQQLQYQLHQLQKLDTQLHYAMQNKVRTLQQQFALLTEKLHALSPLAVLARGYAIVCNEQQQIIRQPSQVQPGQQLQIRLAEGTIIVQVP
jgi:exodeoxyribonuclease VII large subunit